MSNLVSTLTFLLKDEGGAAKAKADAEALKRLGASSADLKKLAAANPQVAKTVAHLDQLAARGAKLDAFRAGARNLKELGQQMRAARAEVGVTAAALAKADGKGARAAEKNHKAALRRAEAITDAWRDQARAHRDLRKTLVNEGVAFGARAENGGRGLALGAAMRAVATDTEHANNALREQVRLAGRSAEQARAVAAAAPQRAQDARDALRSAVQAGKATRAERLEAQAAAKAAGDRSRADNERRRASAGRDMLSGMGGAGRAQLGEVEARRRVAAGMGAPARAKRAASAHEAEAAAVALSERRQARRDAWKGAAGLAGLGAVHRAEHFGGASLHAYAEMDDLMRYQRAVAGLSQDESRSRYKQALHLGGVTGFSDLDVAHAQLDLAQRGVKKELIEPMIEQIVSFAQAMNTTLGDAAKTMEGVVFTTNQDVDNPVTAGQTMRRQVDLAVKGAKLGGLGSEDLKAAFKFGAPTGSSAGLSNETMLAMFGQLRRAGFVGAEAGTAVRSISSRLVSPNSKTLTAYDAMGIDFNKYTTMPMEARYGAPDNLMKRQFGKALSAKQQAQFKALMDDPEAFGDQNEFTKQAVEIASGSFEKVGKGKNKGKMKAQDSARVAKAMNGLWKAMVASIDTEKLWDAILDADPSTGQATLAFGDKRAGQVMALARKKKEFREARETLKHTPDGFAQEVGDTRMGGFAGAKKRLAGAVVSVETALPRSLDAGGEGGALTAITSALAATVQGFAELPPAAHQAAVALGIVGSAFVGVKSMGLLADGFGLKTSATSLTGAAEALTAAAARLGAAGAVDGAANAAGAAAGGKGLGSRLGKLGPAGFLGTAGLGIIAIGAGVELIDYMTPNRNRMNGYGKLAKRPENDLRSYPGGWGPGGGVDVGAGLGATASTFSTNRPKTWSETIFGSTRGGAKDPSRMELPLPPSMMPAPARASAVAEPGFGSRSIPLPPARPAELGGITPKVEVSGADEAKGKLDEVKLKGEEVGKLNITVPVSVDGAGTAIQQLQQIIALGQQANATIGSVNAGTLRGRSSGNSFSDGVTPGRGAE